MHGHTSCGLHFPVVDWQVGGQSTVEVKEGGLRVESMPLSSPLPLSKPMCFRGNGAEKKGKSGSEQRQGPT